MVSPKAISVAPFITTTLLSNYYYVIVLFLSHYNYITHVITMKHADATLPPALPTLLLYTSILVAPVARIAVTCNTQIYIISLL